MEQVYNERSTCEFQNFNLALMPVTSSGKQTQVCVVDDHGYVTLKIGYQCKTYNPQTHIQMHEDVAVQNETEGVNNVVSSEKQTVTDEKATQTELDSVKCSEKLPTNEVELKSQSLQTDLKYYQGENGDSYEQSTEYYAFPFPQYVAQYLESDIGRSGNTHQQDAEVNISTAETQVKEFYEEAPPPTNLEEPATQKRSEKLIDELDTKYVKYKDKSDIGVEKRKTEDKATATTSAHQVKSNVRRTCCRGKRPKDDCFRAHVEIECAFHLPRVWDKKLQLPMAPSTYVSFQSFRTGDLIVTPVVLHTTDPNWRWHCDVKLPADLLVNVSSFWDFFHVIVSYFHS